MPNFKAHGIIMQLCEDGKGKKWRFGACAYSWTPIDCLF
jgi:hypothetical protein